MTKKSFYRGSHYIPQLIEVFRHLYFVQLKKVCLIIGVESGNLDEMKRFRNSSEKSVEDAIAALQVFLL